MITSETLLPGNYHCCGETDTHRWCFHNVRGVKTIAILEFSDNALPGNNGLKFLFDMPAFTFTILIWLTTWSWEQMIYSQFLEEVENDNWK